MKSISCFHSSTLAPLLQTIIDGILAINETLSSKFRLKTNAIFTRLIKKFGGEEITNLIPERKIILRKRLRNLRKTVSKEKRLKEQRANKEDESDDSDGEEFNDKNPPTRFVELYNLNQCVLFALIVVFNLNIFSCFYQLLKNIIKKKIQICIY